MESYYKVKIEKLIEENGAKLAEKEKEIIEYKNAHENYN